ncbi:unnamed protein product [Cunninghamella echinulata]
MGKNSSIEDFTLDIIEDIDEDEDEDFETTNNDSVGSCERESFNSKTRWYCIEDIHGELCLTRTTLCLNKQNLRNYRTIQYPLKLCMHCQAYGAAEFHEPSCPEVVNKDVNAARNIRRINVAYIQESSLPMDQRGSINQRRPPALRSPESQD